MKYVIMYMLYTHTYFWKLMLNCLATHVIMVRCSSMIKKPILEFLLSTVYHIHNLQSYIVHTYTMYNTPTNKKIYALQKGIGFSMLFNANIWRNYIHTGNIKTPIFDKKKAAMFLSSQKLFLLRYILYLLNGRIGICIFDLLCTVSVTSSVLTL